jgi:nucleotide-binding universal stress UspA family protein
MTNEISWRVQLAVKPGQLDNFRELTAEMVETTRKIEGEVIQIRAEQESTALLQQMEKARYDFLVMGGYSHPRWLEFIFGGTTESVLWLSKIPVLVSH